MNWFKNLRIKSKLIAGFSLVIVFAILLASLAVFTVNRLDSMNSYLLNFPEQRLEYLRQIEKDCSDMRRSTTAITLNLGNSEMVEKYWEQFTAAYDDAIENTEKYIESNSSDAVRSTAELKENNKIMSDAKKQLENYKEQADNAMALARINEFEATNSAFLAGAPIIAESIESVGRLALSATTFAANLSETNTAEKDSAVIMFWVLLAVIVVASFVIAIYIAGLISKPMALLTTFMARAANTGDIKLTPEDISNIKKFSQLKDEIGQCIDSTAKFISHVSEASNNLETVAGGDLRVNINLLSQKDVMGLSLNKMADSLNSMFVELKAASDQVLSGAGQVSQSAQGLANGSSEQAASVEELTAFTTEVKEQVNENAMRSEKVLANCETAVGLMGTSMESMRQMMEAMSAINERSKSITKVIKVIDDIAFQTNILALNAAVEAARAGQHGKGFAVVADEVRNLAAKSAEAAKETASLIEGSSQSVNEGSKIVEQTNESLNSVSATTTQNAELIREMVKSLDKQTTSVAAINQGMDQISSVIQSNSATAEQSAAAAQEMSAQSVFMNEIVARFKLRHK